MTEILKFNIDGVDTVVETIGYGKPIIFLHGAATLEGFDFAVKLAENYKVYLPNHPGFGLSGDAPDISSMADMVIHYLNLLDHLNLSEKPHLIGFSMGGWMAAELACVAREKFDRVVFVAPAGINHPDYPPAALSQIQPEDLPGYLSHDVNVALKYFPSPSDQQAAETFGLARQREGKMVERILTPTGMGHPNLPSRIARITNPSLVIWGECDRLLPPQSAQLWADALPDAKLHIAPNTGHLVLQEAPDTLTVIRDFLAQ